MSRSPVRTSVSLSKEQHLGLSAIAKKLDVSIAWVIRHAVQRYLEENEDLQLQLPIQITVEKPDA